MTKVFMTKSSSDAEWGFDLDAVANGQGDSSWITISKVDEDSPSCGKLEIGDRLLEIAGNCASDISLNDAWDLIKRCSNALFLTVERKGSPSPADPSVPAATKTTTIRAMATAHELATQTARKPESVRRTSVNAKDFIRRQDSFTHDEAGSHTEAEPLIPTAPPLTADWMKQVYRKPVKEAQAPDDNPKQQDEFEQQIPDKLLRTMTKPGMKPFTYTPRGVDLQEVVEKARSRRHAHRMAQAVQPEERQVEQVIIDASRSVPSPQTVQQMSASISGQPWNAPVYQSKSFQRLRGWIEDNALASPSATGGEVTAKSPVALALEQSNVISNTTNRTIPSNAFRILQQSCGPDLTHNPQALSIEQEKYDKERATQELYRRVPARDREREPEAHKYQGADIPSRSFRFLQEHTAAETASAPGPVYPTKPEPVPYEDRHASVPSRSFRLLQQLSGEGDALQPPSPRLRNIEKPNVRVFSTEF